jgi:hypothetical protein
VSERIGVVGSTAIETVSCLGFCGSRVRAVMAPTRTPLNSTLEPTVSPDTGCSKRIS